MQSAAIPTALACLSQMKMLSSTLATLHKTPMTVNEVAVTCFRKLKPAYEIPTPTTHDMSTAEICPKDHSRSLMSSNSWNANPSASVGGMESTLL